MGNRWDHLQAAHPRVVVLLRAVRPCRHHDPRPDHHGPIGEAIPGTGREGAGTGMVGAGFGSLEDGGGSDLSNEQASRMYSCLFAM